VLNGFVFFLHFANDCLVVKVSFKINNIKVTDTQQSLEQTLQRRHIHSLKQ
jgi:hypothetical protein